MRNREWLMALLATTVVSTSALADQNTAMLTVKVTINAAPCEINGNTPIDVDFGSSVAVTDVEAGLVEKDIVYTLDCGRADKTKSLKMVIAGTGADFDADSLKTSMTDLGVKIQASGADYPLNTALNFASADTKPALKAVLVQKPGARLQTGAFTAGATMTVEYQ